MWVPRNKQIKKIGGSIYKYLSERAHILMREIYWHIYQWKLGFINEKKNLLHTLKLPLSIFSQQVMHENLIHMKMKCWTSSHVHATY